MNTKSEELIAFLKRQVKRDEKAWFGLYPDLEGLKGKLRELYKVNIVVEVYHEKLWKSRCEYFGGTKLKQSNKSPNFKSYESALKWAIVEAIKTI